MKRLSFSALVVLSLLTFSAVFLPAASGATVISSNATVGSSAGCTGIGGTVSGETCLVGAITIDPDVTLMVANNWALDPSGEVLVNGTLLIEGGNGMYLLPPGFIVDYGNVTVTTSGTVLLENTGTNVTVYGSLQADNGGFVNGGVYAECGASVSGDIYDGVTGLCAPKESVGCTPSPQTEYEAATCLAFLDGFKPPTGTVSWNNTGTGSFNSTSCTLYGYNSTASFCAVTYTPTATSGESVTGGYGGDSAFASDSATYDLNVTAPPTLIVGTPSATLATVDQGESSSLSSTFSGGVPGYTCQWLQEQPDGSSFTDFGSSYSCSSPANTQFTTIDSTTPGSWKFELQVTDNVSTSVTSSSRSVTVDLALVAGPISPSNPTLKTGETSITLTANPSGGTGAYSYQWYAAASCSADEISGATSPTYNTGNLSANAIYSYKVTDSAPSPQSVCSAADAVTVIQPPPPVELPPTPPPTVTFNFGAGGIAPLVGNYVMTQDGTLIYNVPGYDATTDLLPYAVSACYIASEDLVRVTGFYSVGPGDNSTELAVSNWNTFVTSSAGWPTEPACST